MGEIAYLIFLAGAAVLLAQIGKRLPEREYRSSQDVLDAMRSSGANGPG